MFVMIYYMIAHITGMVIELNEKYTVVDVSGVGYKAFATPDTLRTLKLGVQTSLFTYLSVRETALDLYGFDTAENQNFFELLLNVSGIGPKSALSILSIATVETLQKAISTGDTSYLTKVSGIGRKTAEKIVLELRDKLKAHANSGTDLQGESDVVLALQSLGYSQTEARDALKQVANETLGTNARIKEALQILGGK